MKKASFWLTTAGEYGPLAEPRQCTLVGEIRSALDGGIIVALELDPPFSDEHLSPPAISEKFITVSRALGGGYSLTEEMVSRVLLFDSPLLVRIGRIVDLAILQTRVYDRGQLQPLPRGSLFRNRIDAIEFYHNISKVL